MCFAQFTPFPKKLTLFGDPDIYFSVYIDSFYYAVHNHPDNGCLSLGDLINFLKRRNMLGLEAIEKNGYNSSIIIKTFESNVDEYNEFILNEIDKFDNEHPDYNVENDFDLANDFCKMILKKGEEYGFEIVRG